MGALQTIKLYEKEEELKKRENRVLALEATIKIRQEELIVKAKKVKKSVIEAKWVAAQLRLMAGQLDRLANEILEEVN